MKPKKPQSKRDCPITADSRVRLKSEAQTATIQDHFPKGISQPALRALFAAGLKRTEDLAKISEKGLAALHGMGPKAIAILREEMKAKRIAFRKE
jgi:hypothetical protein